MGEPTNSESESAPPEELSLEQGDNLDVSIQALRLPTKNLISALLNPAKIFLSDSGLPRDWHGLAELVGVGGERIPHLHCGRDATNQILSLWYKDDKKGATIKRLLSFLEQIDRFDIIDDAKLLIEEDIKVYEQCQEQRVLSNNISIKDTDHFILTTDDITRAEQGLEPQKYDAFVLFADDDIAFVTELIDKLENQYKLKLCVKDRDLVVGVFEHDSIIKLIAERCNRLIAVISSSFLESSSNKFFCSFGQFLGIEQRRRKIVPCLYSQCKIPPELSCYFMLDYKRAGLGNFWERLRDSVRTPASIPLENQNIHRSVSQKLSPICQDNEVTLSCKNNSLKPKKDGVKFSSMTNLHYDIDEPFLDEKPNSSMNSLNSITVEKKKSKSRVGWLKKLLPPKSDKCRGDVIEEAPQHHKKGFFTKNIKRKVAVAT